MCRYADTQRCLQEQSFYPLSAAGEERVVDPLKADMTG
jgi:hypothetical protein